MPAIQANGLTLEYESIGRESDPPILLIMGLGMQLISWPDAFYARLADQGFRVIRFDNRDSGLSSSLDHLGVPHIPAAFMKYVMHLPLQAPYDIDDMAQDAKELLDALEIEQAHIVGASMGGMIAQNMAANFSHKVLSLTSMMSTTGRRGLPNPSWKIQSAIMAPPTKPGTQDEAVARMEKIFRILAGPTILKTKARSTPGVRGTSRAHTVHTVPHANWWR